MEIFKKTVQFQTSKKLQDIVNSFTSSLQFKGWRVQSNVQNGQAVMQVLKAGFLRDVISADRALTFVFKQQDGSENLEVDVGVGKLVQNLAVTAIEVLLLSDIFIFIDIPEILWTKHVETELLQDLRSQL
ncbi:MAG: hypothetical protein AAE983_02060 [Thermoplasmataceae archaeon]|jgi:hypothetical protein